MFSNIPASLQGKHKMAIFAKNNGWCSGSFSSSGGRDQEEELKKLRAQVELLSKQQRVEKGTETQGEPTRRESGLKEDCQMEVEEAKDCKKNWMSRRKVHRNICDTLRNLLRDSQKEKWKGQLQEIEMKRTELLPEHQKKQKRSQKLQRLQDKKSNYLKDACACEDEMQTLSEEMEKRQALFHASFQALSERKEEAAARHSPMDVALVQPRWSSSSRREQHRLCSSSLSFREKSEESTAGNISQSQPLRSMWQEENRQKSGTEIRTKRRRQVGGTKALRWILLWILLGVKMQTVKALEEEIPAH